MLFVCLFACLIGSFCVVCLFLYGCSLVVGFCLRALFVWFVRLFVLFISLVCLFLCLIGLFCVVLFVFVWVQPCRGVLFACFVCFFV